MTGRPSIYTPELAEDFFQRMADGEFVQDICKDAGMPSITTLSRWRGDNEGFRKGYAQAREMQASQIARNGFARATNAQDAQLDRLAYDAAKWMASKLDPANYGDKLQHANAAGDGDQRVETNMTVTFRKPGV